LRPRRSAREGGGGMTDNLLPAEEIVANLAAKRIGELHKELDRVRGNLQALLRLAGVAHVCSGPHCHKSVVLVRHQQSGQLTPYDLDGTNHWLTCPDRGGVWL
jgi:hypothetical protein